MQPKGFQICFCLDIYFALSDNDSVSGFLETVALHVNRHVVKNTGSILNSVKSIKPPNIYTI